MQEVFAVGTSFFEETLGRGKKVLVCVEDGNAKDRQEAGTYVVCHDDRADHTSAQIALLIRRYEVLCHFAFVCIRKKTEDGKGLGEERERYQRNIKILESEARARHTCRKAENAWTRDPLKSWRG
jgi:hypothetical protein